MAKAALTVRKRLSELNNDLPMTYSDETPAPINAILIKVVCLSELIVRMLYAKRNTPLKIL